jgi:phosphoribosyl-ATP pyrophosphohydrolase/phosphoribosyl-AMP cyclohydrolase
MQLNWNKLDGLIPAIIQDSKNAQVLMLGYMNAESLKITQETRLVTFWSRSRQAIWVKGETSGNSLEVVEIQPDCDRDALLVSVRPRGPVCHRETETCFDHEFDFLTELEKIIESRLQGGSSQSYISELIADGLDRVIQKVGEEAIETVIASKNEDLSGLENESADLVFHLMVLLRYKKSSLIKVVDLLRRRHLEKKSERLGSASKRLI